MDLEGAPVDARNRRFLEAQKPRPIDLLTPADVVALMRACSRRAPTGVRNCGLIALLYGSGLRISEALDLRAKDLDLDGLAIVVQSGKGGRRRAVALMPDSVDAIDRWAQRRRRIGATASDPFFCTLGRGASGPHPTWPGRRLSREYFARVLKRLARRAGIDKRVHPHALRHSHADLIRRRGFDVEEVRKQLGHRDLTVTTRYLDHLGSHDLPEKMRSLGAVLVERRDLREPRDEVVDILSRLGEKQVAELLRALKRIAS